MMLRTWIPFLVCAVCTALAQDSPTSPAKSKTSPVRAPTEPPTVPLLIRDVNVIDCTGKETQPAMSVLISEGRITAIRPATNLEAPVAAHVVNGHGKYLIPGLWNMHVHLGAYADAKRAMFGYLAEGITGLRDMGSPLGDILRLRKDVNEGAVLGPALVIAGPIIQGPLPFHMPLFTSVTNAAEARQTVALLQESGVDFVKVQDAIPHELYEAVAKQARREHLPFVGHIPPTVLPEEASNLGQHSIEHLGGRFWGVLIGCSSLESELHTEEIEMYRKILDALDRKQPPPDPNMRAAFIKKVLGSYDPTKAEALFSRFREHGTWQCPTLVVLRKLWDDPNSPYTAEDLRWARQIMETSAELVKRMERAGVGLLAGTDLSPSAKDGTIHDELAYLVAAGLTPIQALQTATREPANFLGQLSIRGTIEAGKFADLVLLRANPLEDIHNTTNISMVILRGHIIMGQSGVRQQ